MSTQTWFWRIMQHSIYSTNSIPIRTVNIFTVTKMWWPKLLFLSLILASASGKFSLNPPCASFPSLGTHSYILHFTPRSAFLLMAVAEIKGLKWTPLVAVEIKAPLIYNTLRIVFLPRPKFRKPNDMRPVCWPPNLNTCLLSKQKSV